MTFKKISILIYGTLLFACIFSCTGYISKSTQGEYAKTLQALKYQMDYTQVYSTNVSNSNGLDSAEEVGQINAGGEDIAAQSKPEQDIPKEEKIVYLTFDDGPSARTLEILDILKEHGVPATFFVVNSEKDEDKAAIKRAFDEGHSIGVHTASHNYRKIYKSVDSYLEDFEICFNYVCEITGSPPKIFRFPGGSKNNFNRNIYKDLTQEMLRRGFIYFDWNVSSEDATKNYTTQSIYNHIMEGCKNHDVSVVLMHDSAGKKSTVAALKQAIPELLEQGFTFKGLDENVAPVIFKIK
ncbi:MAG: polysaccharide deacetylase family protein [Oscillospiraceae bacterium]